MDLHKLQIFSVHSPTHVHNTRTQIFVEVLESLTYCIEVLFKKKKTERKKQANRVVWVFGACYK